MAGVPRLFSQQDANNQVRHKWTLDSWRRVRPIVRLFEGIRDQSEIADSLKAKRHPLETRNLLCLNLSPVGFPGFGFE